MLAGRKACAVAKVLAALGASLLALECRAPAFAEENAQNREAQAIAEEAYLYGFPMIVNYKVMYEYAIDRSSGQFKAPFNVISNEARVFTPKDTAIVTPNSDTPYSLVELDLRAEPIVLCMPEIEKSRYYDVQLVDLYTDNYGYMGSRATGNGAGCYMVAGPDWNGEQPAGVSKTFRSETQFSFVIYRTQLFNPADMDNVKRIQAGYKVQTLSAFLGRPAPPPAPEIAWPKFEQDAFTTKFGEYLGFLPAILPADRHCGGRKAVAREIRPDRHRRWRKSSSARAPSRAEGGARRRGEGGPHPDQRDGRNDRDRRQRMAGRRRRRRPRLLSRRLGAARRRRKARDLWQRCGRGRLSLRQERGERPPPRR
jgi:hypothetical protein